MRESLYVFCTRESRYELLGQWAEQVQAERIAVLAAVGMLVSKKDRTDQSAISHPRKKTAPWSIAVQGAAFSIVFYFTQVQVSPEEALV